MTSKIIIPVVCTILSSLSGYCQMFQYHLPYERELGKEKVRSEFITYRKINFAKENKKDSSENVTFLNGEWKYTKTSNPEETVKTNNIDDWTSIIIPDIKCQIRQPLYSPNKLPVMDESLDFTRPNDYTVFSRYIYIPFDYIDKAIFLHIGALSGKAIVYVNGTKMAVFRSPLLPSEVKISSAIQQGKNRINIVVEPYNEESLLDRWNTQYDESILRESYIFAQPKIRMFDFTHKTSLDPTYKNGLLEAALVLKTELINPHQITVYYDLYDKQGQIVNSDYKNVEIGDYRYDTIRFISSIKNVSLWSSKKPDLYTIVYRIKRDGRFTEITTRKVGFRQVEITGDSLLINGKREQICGINADLFPVLTTKISSTSEIESLFNEFKSKGINAIRTPYPLRKEVYEAADKIGIYISEVAPICSQGLSKSVYKGGTLANNPAWSSVFVSRAVEAYDRIKDFTSVIMIEMGENAGNGCCIYDAYNKLKGLDPYRPIVYGDAEAAWNTDIFCSNKKYRRTKYNIKPYIQSRLKYSKDCWNIGQGGFLDDGYENLATSNHKGTTGSITTRWISKNQLNIHNGMECNLNEYDISYIIMDKNGNMQVMSTPQIDLEPGKETEITIPQPTGKKRGLLVIGGTIKIEL